MERILYFTMFIRRDISPLSFMDANVGNNPSFVWRSLLQARDIITEGGAWKIGDGETVGIDSHKWLPKPPSFKPGVDRTLKVSRGGARNFGLGGQVVMLVYYLRQTSTHTYKLIY